MTASRFPIHAVPKHLVPSDASGEEQSFAALEQECIEHILEMAPDHAVYMGLHAYDGLFPDVSEASLTRWIGRSRDFLQRLDGVDPRQLPPERRLDLTILHLRLESDLFWSVDFPSWDLSPGSYLFGIQLTEYVSREYAPPEVRAHAVLRAFHAIPAFLAQGLPRLKDPLPRPFVTLGMDMAQGLPNHFREAARFVSGVSPADKPEVQDALAEVLDATEAMAQRLEEALPNATRPFQLGSELFQRLLSVTDGLTLTWQELLEEGRADLRRNQERLRRLASSLSPPRTPAEAIADLTQDISTSDRILEEARGYVGDLRQFVIEREIASLPEDAPCQVEESPPADRAFAFASMRSPGPFEENPARPAYRLTLPDPAWEKGKQEEWLRSLNRPLLKNITVHEVYPGHYLQFQHFRHSSPSPTRKAFWSGAFAEGWGHYSEQLAIEEGYGAGDPRQEIAQLQDALLRDCRLIASVEMHARGISLEEATRIFVRDAYMEPFPAEREARRGTFNPTYFIYTLGKLRILRARTAYFGQRPGATLREFHDRLLSFGAPPVGHLEDLLFSSPPP